MWIEEMEFYRNEIILVYKVNGNISISLSFKPYITLLILELQMNLDFLIALQWN
jgi:hypothetical protein